MPDPQPARRLAATALAALAALILVASLVVGYASGVLFDADEFADRATAALESEAVQEEVAGLVIDDMLLEADADLVAVRPVIESVIEGLVGGSAFQGLFHAALRDVHRAAFEEDQNTVTLTLADVGAVVRGAAQALRPGLAADIDAGLDAELTRLRTPAWIADVARTAERIEAVPLFLLALAVGLAAAALWLAPDRRRAVLQLGIATAVVAMVSVVALGVARAVVLDGIDAVGARAAVDAVWGSFLDDLRLALYLTAASGAVVAAAASSLLRPVAIDAQLRRGWQALTTVPRSRGMQAARAISLLAAGILIVVRHDAAIGLLVVLVGLYIAYAGASELMRLTVAADAGERSLDAHQGRRALIAAGIASVAILGAGAAFAAVGATDREPAPLPGTGCNGSEELCERRLDELATPATHNAMSAATNKGWLFAQQDAGLSEQLADGIRGLLIDAHYGERVEGGQVRTDLSDVSASERAELEQSLGPAAFDAAVRLRDRVVGTKAEEERSVYLCHGFCELGALPIERAFGELRDFLAANPHEVLVVVIEDYVDPQDIATAAESSGLAEFVYEGEIDPPPTLEEMIDSGGRVLMAAENDGGGEAIPWYHEVYAGLTQETPYSFGRTSELIDSEAIPASCEPNRGPAGAPMFLVNHWIDTSPAPRPSNAREVNALDALLARVEECEELRGLRANLIAVDFYRQGDLFAAVEALNAD